MIAEGILCHGTEYVWDDGEPAVSVVVVSGGVGGRADRSLCGRGVGPWLVKGVEACVSMDNNITIPLTIKTRDQILQKAFQILTVF